MVIVKESCYFGFEIEGVFICSNFLGCIIVFIYLFGL